MAFQQNRGNYGNQRSNNGGGGNGNGGGFRGGNNQGGQRGGAPSNYLRSSTFVKNIILDGDKVDGQPAPRELAPLSPGVTEEIAITLTAAKVNELFERLQNAVNDPQGDGGVRITLYCQHKTNQDTGEEFDGASLMIVGKFPPKNQQQGGRGSFNGSGGGQGRGGNNGRRDYGNQGGGQGNGQQQSRGNANSDTQQSGQQDRGNQSQGNQQGGRTQNAQSDASHSNEGKSDTRGGNGSQQTTSHSNQQSYDEPGW